MYLKNPKINVFGKVAISGVYQWKKNIFSRQMKIQKALNGQRVEKQR